MEVYIGNIPNSATTEDITILLKPYTSLERMDYRNNGFAFARFGSEVDGNHAISNLSGVNLHGKSLLVQRSNNDYPGRKSHHHHHHSDSSGSGSGTGAYRVPEQNTLYVGNLPSGATKEEVRGLFEPFGNITRLVTNDQKGYLIGFVTFENRSDATKAQQSCNNTILRGSQINVQFSRQSKIRRQKMMKTNSNNSSRPSSYGGGGGYRSHHSHSHHHQQQHSQPPPYSSYGTSGHQAYGYNPTTSSTTTPGYNPYYGYGAVPSTTGTYPTTTTTTPYSTTTNPYYSSSTTTNPYNPSTTTTTSSYVPPPPPPPTSSYTHNPYSRSYPSTTTTTTDQRNSTLYVGNIPTGTSRGEIENIFGAYGKIDNLSVYSSYAFVKFSDASSVDRVIPMSNQMKIMGRPVVLNRAYRPPSETGGTALFVGNLPKSTNNADLEGIFSRVGQINGVKILRNEHDGTARFGFVTLSKYSEAMNAIRTLNGQVQLKGNFLKVELSQSDKKSNKPAYPNNNNNNNYHQSRRERSKSPVSIISTPPKPIIKTKKKKKKILDEDVGSGVFHLPRPPSIEPPPKNKESSSDNDNDKKKVPKKKKKKGDFYDQFISSSNLFTKTEDIGGIHGRRRRLKQLQQLQTTTTTTTTVVQKDEIIRSKDEELQDLRTKLIEVEELMSRLEKEREEKEDQFFKKDDDEEEKGMIDEEKKKLKGLRKQYLILGEETELVELKNENLKGCIHSFINLLPPDDFIISSPPSPSTPKKKSKLTSEEEEEESDDDDDDEEIKKKKKKSKKRKRKEDDFEDGEIVFDEESDDGEPPKKKLKLDDDEE